MKAFISAVARADCTNVEERPFEGRVSGMLTWALAPVNSPRTTTRAEAHLEFPGNAALTGGSSTSFQ